METGITVSTAQIVSVVVGGLSVIGFLFKLLLSAKDKAFDLAIADKDKAVKEAESKSESLQDAANKAIRTALEIANMYKRDKNQPEIVPTADVLAEANSPSTKAQLDTADLATIRATTAQIRLAVGLPATTNDEEKMA